MKKELMTALFVASILCLSIFKISVPDSKDTGISICCDFEEWMILIKIPASRRNALRIF